MMPILMNALKIALSVMITVSGLVYPASSEAAKAPFAPVDKEACQLSFIAVSDTHVRRGDNDITKGMFDTFIPGLEASEVKPDAFIITGDVTHGGEEEDWKYTQELLEGKNIADRTLLAVGNHDTWTDENYEKTYKELFLEYNRKITGEKVSNVYYSTKINGYYFIFLGSEDDGTDAYFSDKQIKWLKSEMKKAAKTKKPIFVISHWPLNKTHGLPVSWGDEEYTDMTGGIGEQSDKVKEILNKYNKVFYITGHIHNGFSNSSMKEYNGYTSVEKIGNITSVNLPSVANLNFNGHFISGTGYCVEVYKDKVLFRARNFMNNYWLPGYDYTVVYK